MIQLYEFISAKYEKNCSMLELPCAPSMLDQSGSSSVSPVDLADVPSMADHTVSSVSESTILPYTWCFVWNRHQHTAINCITRKCRTLRWNVNNNNRHSVTWSIMWSIPVTFVILQFSSLNSYHAQFQPLAHSHCSPRQCFPYKTLLI